MLSNTLEFLRKLETHNERDWFHTNNEQYQKAKKEFEIVVNTIIPMLGKEDPYIGFPESKDCIFRIHRDIRFSKNKTPYKTNFGAFIARGGRKSSNAGYYIHIQPGQSFAGGGIYMPGPENLKKIRNEIFFNSDEFNSLPNEESFLNYFNGLQDLGKLKRPPKGFPPDFQGIEYLKSKSFVVGNRLPDKILYQDGLINYLIDTFRAMISFNKFLNRAID